MAQATPNPLADDALLRTQIHALSLADFHAQMQYSGLAYHTSQRDDGSIAKHINLLDGFALLLVRKPQHDVVATSMRLTGSGVIFYWARNDNQTIPAESEHIQRLLRHSSQGSVTKVMLTDVVSYSSKKIIARCKKIARFLDLSMDNRRPTESNLLKVNIDSQEYHDLEKRIRNLGVISQQEPLVKHLDGLVRRLAGIGHSSSTEDMVKCIIHSWQLCIGSPALTKLALAPVGDKLRKVSDYLRSANSLCREVQRLKTMGYPHPNIQIEQVGAQCTLDNLVRGSLIGVRFTHDKALSNLSSQALLLMP